MSAKNISTDVLKSQIKFSTKIDKGVAKSLKIWHTSQHGSTGSNQTNASVWSINDGQVGNGRS